MAVGMEIEAGNDGIIVKLEGERFMLSFREAEMLVHELLNKMSLVSPGMTLELRRRIWVP